VSLEVDQCILTAGNAPTCVWHLQSLGEGGERFEHFQSLLTSLQKSVCASPQTLPPRSNSSLMTDRNALFHIISSRDCKLFEEADRELSISGLAFDCFLGRVRGLERAKRILRGLEVRQRRFLSFGHLFWSVCKVRDNGQTISDVESWGLEEGFLEAEDDEDDDDVDVEADRDTGPEINTHIKHMKNFTNINKIDAPLETLELKENPQSRPLQQRAIRASPKVMLPLAINTLAISKPKEGVSLEASPHNTRILIPIIHTKDMLNAINEDSNLSSFESSSLSFTSTSEFSSV
jgi:hypothetical protein